MFVTVAGISHAQVISNMEGGAGGVISSTNEGYLTGDEYSADGIIFQWEAILKDYENYDGGKSLEDKIEKIEQTTQGGGVNTMKDNYGKLFTLPEIIDENGIDLFLLTEEGITIYMALDAPVYLQETESDIVKWIRYYAYKKRPYTKRIFSRYEKWEKTIKTTFDIYGVPKELAELCLIESGCTTDALSPAGARGMWQIMPETGRSLGLTINQFTDERLDPVKSLHAAAKLLRGNYIKTQDWALSAAAYNCGPGHILRQQKKGASEWKQIQRKLPKETQQYVPALIAIHYVWTYRERLGF